VIDSVAAGDETRTRESARAAAPRDLGAILVVSLLWGMNWPTLGLALRDLSPWTVRAFTLSVAGLLLLGYNIVRHNSLRVPRRDWPCLVAVTLLYIVLQNLMISYAQQLAPTGRMATVTFTMPMWTTLLAALLLGERINRARVISLVLGAAGLLALAWPALKTATYWGWLFALFSAWCWAGSTILIKRHPINANALAVATWQLLIGGSIISAGMFALEGVPASRAISSAVALSLGYNILSQCISQVLWFGALDRLPAAIASLGVLLVPTVALVGATLILGERPTLLDVAGLLMITAASAIAQLAWLRGRAADRKAILHDDLAL